MAAGKISMVKRRGRPRGAKSKTVAKATPAVTNMIKSIARRQMETKQSSFYGTGLSLFHNQTSYISGLLGTTQGTASPSYFSTTTPNGQRIGDKIFGKYIRFQLYHECADTRPNSVVKYFVFYYNAGIQPTDTTFWSGSTSVGGNLFRMIDQPNNDNVTILKSGIIQHQPNYYSSGSGFSTRNCCTYRKFNVKINRNITYLDDNSNVPKFKDIGFCIVNCDQNGTIQTDRVGYYNISTQFFYKDG